MSEPKRKIRINDEIRDNDPRCPDRVLFVHDVGPTHVMAARNPDARMVRIRIDRIHMDQKKRRSGWRWLRHGGAP